MSEFVQAPRLDGVFALDPGQRWLTVTAAHDPAMARPVQRVYALRRGVRSGDLLAAVRYVTSAHPALRMRLVHHDGRLAQRFDDDRARIEGVSVQGRTAALRAAYAQHLFQEQARRPLDLHREAPVHLLAIEVDGDHFLGVAMDHRAADETAMDLFEHELDAAWRREATGLPHPEVDHTPYVAALHEQAARGAEEARNLEWWMNELCGSPLAASTGELSWVPGSTATMAVTGPQLTRMADRCRERRVPLSALVLAAQLAWWRQRTSSPDVVVNVPVSNRTRAVEHSWIANRSMLMHLRFRSHLDAGDLTGVRDVLLEGMRHRHYDYGSLSDAVSADAAARGGRLSWLLGVSHVAERRPSPVGLQLLAERLDDRADARLAVPRGSFSLTARQTGLGLALRAEWDGETWGPGTATFIDELTHLLSRVTA